MKIQNLLEAIMDTQNPQFVLTNLHTFKFNDDILDGAFAITDRSNGVVYACDVEFNPKTGEYKLTNLDVQDHGKTYDGDDQDRELLTNFINTHKQELINKFMEDAKDGDFMED